MKPRKALHEPAVHREIMTPQDVLQRLAKDLDQDLRAALLADAGQHLQLRIQRDTLEDCRVRSFQRLTDLGDELDRIPARDRLSNDVAQDHAGGREGGMTDILHRGHQPRQGRQKLQSLGHLY